MTHHFSQSLNILYAEDSRSIAQYYVQLLTQMGHKVRHVENGALAVEAFLDKKPDLILMDVVMPEMDGISACIKIKAMCGESWTPLVLLTSQGENDEVVKGLEAGADDYLVKPVPQEVVVAKIRSMQRIAQIQNTLASILDNTHDGIITIGEDGIVRSFNVAAQQIFGYSSNEVIGKNVSLLMPPPYREEHDGYLAHHAKTGEKKIIGLGRKVFGQRKNNSIFPLRLAVSEVNLGNSKLFIGLLRDITEEETYRKKLEHMALHDALTGLANRAQFNQQLEQHCEQLDSNPFALLFFDLDGFKPINDQYGHEAGDEVLRVIAGRMRGELPEKDVVARLGGDEFVVLLNTLDDSDKAIKVAKRLLATISQPILIGDKHCQVSASIGVVLAPLHGRTETELLSLADKTMYEAKNNGKGRVIVAS